MINIEKSAVFDLLLAFLEGSTEDPDEIDLYGCRTFMEVVAEAVQRGTAVNALSLHKADAEYATWCEITDMLYDLGIDATTFVFVRDSVHHALDMLMPKESDMHED